MPAVGDVVGWPAVEVGLATGDGVPAGAFEAVGVGVVWTAQAAR
jgi:hypothetical protein